MSGFHALIVDDDREMRDSLSHLLTRAGWRATTASSGAAALAKLEATEPDVILSDVRMPGMSGIELMQALPVGAPRICLISAHGDIPTAVEAVQAGAYTFLEKPFDPRRLLTVLSHAAEQHHLATSAARLKARLADLSGLDRILLGQTPQIVRLREDILSFAEIHVPVMLLGETGVGKELVAHALHDLSPQADRPFIAVNCAAIPVARFEEVMFGVDGAPGMIRRADGGALFLDEIGACPLEGQAKLLRALETGTFMPVGALAEEQVTLRVISASNEDLVAAVKEGRFREDLLFRLNTLVLSLPPLRERRDDIPFLFQHFVDRIAEVYEVSAPDLTAEDVAALIGHDWPGNVRELRNIAERYVLAARRGSVLVADAIAGIASGSAPDVGATNLRAAVASLERQMIARAVADHEGRMDDIAEALGIGRRTLNEKIVKLGLNKSDLL